MVASHGYHHRPLPQKEVWKVKHSLWFMTKAGSVPESVSTSQNMEYCFEFKGLSEVGCLRIVSKGSGTPPEV